MIVLGINASHNSTACLLKDGKVVSCISEERLCRVKNKPGLPTVAIAAVLKEAGITPDKVDRVAFSFKDMLLNSGFGIYGGVEGQVGSRVWFTGVPLFWKIKQLVLAYIPKARFIYLPLQRIFYEFYLFPRIKRDFLVSFERKTKIKKQKVEFIDHHTCHAYSAFFGSPRLPKGKKLILTLDGMGDGACATVSVGEGEEVTEISRTSVGNSVGDLYAYVTKYLGMKLVEDEYKVMGLAAYAKEESVAGLYSQIKDWIWVNKQSLTFESRIFSHAYLELLPGVFRNERFDSIAGAVQKLTEELISEWAEAAIRNTSISDLVCGGGVFMNVKANQKIAQLSVVKSLFVFPSCGDESTAIGAAYFLYQKERLKNPRLPQIEPLQSLYFGPEFESESVGNVLKRRVYSKYQIKKVKNIERAVARLISKKKIVARFAGKMEWGARALGNRSILAHPQSQDAIREINRQIKSRDFWMPFAPSILSERVSRYVVNPKGFPGYYMMLAYKTTAEGQEKLLAAIHQYDFSVRPQEVTAAHNLRYYKLIKEFEKISGIGAVLNTSFNLHGAPIVCSPQDALSVFEKSGLAYLALEDYLVSKKSKSD